MSNPDYFVPMFLTKGFYATGTYQAQVVVTGMCNIPHKYVHYWERILGRARNLKGTAE